LNARSALLGLFVALTIVLASTTVYESGIRTTLTVTSTTRLTTSALASSVLLGNTAFVLNSSDHLSLSVQVEPGPNGSYTFTVRESNLLNSVNNVTGVRAIEWAYPQNSLGPYPPVLYGSVVELAVVQGHYGGNNYTSSEALVFYSGPCTCAPQTEIGDSPYVYPFQPLNDTFSNPDGSPRLASASVTTSGYWTVGQDGVAAMKPFPPGAYTVIGADEWGSVVLLQAFLE
jgi:hypothetical protein